jgi:peptide chain release factor 1
MDKKLAEVENRLEEVNRMLADPEVLGDRARFQAVAREHKELTPVVETWRKLRDTRDGIATSRELARDDDPEMAAMAREELAELQAQEQVLAAQLKVMLLPKDPMDGRDAFLEIRAGAGGDEAALFAADLFRMYSRVAESRGWRVEIASVSETGIGGYKEVIANIAGEDVYSLLKYESGVHRVQRVPATESQGRIHTSTVTVAVLPEASEVDVEINEAKDLRIDVFRSSGPGGQSVNTTDSAVRVTHLPTGLVVSCQDEKSQHKNKAKALRVLRARLYEAELAKQQAEMAAARKAQVGTGERSERIRTYNYPENRVSDHRIGLTVHQLDRILNGELVESIIEPLSEHFQAEMLKAGGASGL